jgi:hypothetical protein
LIHQIRPLYTHAHQVQSGEVCRDLHCSCSMSAWSSKDDNFRSMITVCCSFLGATARFSQNSLDPQFSLSYVDGWLDRMSKSNCRGYAQSLCDRASRQLGPFEALYGRHCRSPLNWIEPGEKAIFGPDLIDEAEATVHYIQYNLMAKKSCQESYANKR